MKKGILKAGLLVLAVLITVAVLFSTVFSNPVKVHTKNEVISIGVSNKNERKK